MDYLTLSHCLPLKTGTSGEYITQSVESGLHRRRCVSYIASPFNVLKRVLERHRTSSCARAPFWKPPPGETPFAKFKARGFKPLDIRLCAATRVV